MSLSQTSLRSTALLHNTLEILLKLSPAIALAIGMTVFLLMYLPSMAKQVGLVASPDLRKRHQDQIPLIGGIAIVIAVFFSMSLLPFGLSRFRIFVLCLGLLLIVGVLDDHQDLPASARFLMHLLISSILVIGDEVVVRSIGDIFGWFDGNEQGLGLVAVPLTIVGITGVINAFNMIDGHDGVGVSVFLLSGTSLIGLSFMHGDYVVGYLLMLFCCSASVFLVFNLSKSTGLLKKSFLGDAGSTCLGLTIVYVLIVFSQKESTPILRTVTAPWIIGLPLIDMFAVIIKRFGSGRSPVRADRSHIHHILIDRGLKSHTVLLLLVGIQGVFCAIALVANTLLPISDWILFWGMFILLGIFLSVSFYLRVEHSDADIS